MFTARFMSYPKKDKAISAAALTLPLPTQFPEKYNYVSKEH
jgi:hypothetical protein